MNGYLMLFVGTVLMHNFVLVKFLGLCHFMRITKSGRPWHWYDNDVRHDASVYLRLVYQ
ncbi:MAG: Ion-translocating oxidoreductase complex subunit A [Sodalis sp.]|nr:MAG: Ion-translocating oxidoreductase complex subunit A [Sodalis sp.]